MNTHQSATNQEIEDKTDDGSLTGPNASACCSIEEQDAAASRQSMVPVVAAKPTNSRAIVDG